MFGRFMLRRLKEPSTWAGLVTVVTAVAGLNLDPAQREAVIAAGVSLVGVLLAFARESGEKDAAAVDKALKEATKASRDQVELFEPPAPKSTDVVRPDIGAEYRRAGTNAPPTYPRPPTPEPPPTRGLQGRVGRNR